MFEEILEDVILTEKRVEWNQLRSIDCTDNITAKATNNCSPEFALIPTRKKIKKSRDYLNKSLDVQKCCACVAKLIVATIERVTSTNSVARDSRKEL